MGNSKTLFFAVICALRPAFCSVTYLLSAFQKFRFILLFFDFGENRESHISVFFRIRKVCSVAVAAARGCGTPGADFRGNINNHKYLFILCWEVAFAISKKHILRKILSPAKRPRWFSVFYVIWRHKSGPDTRSCASKRGVLHCIPPIGAYGDITHKK